jgi:hypothetical protein
MKLLGNVGAQINLIKSRNLKITILSGGNAGKFESLHHFKNLSTGPNLLCKVVVLFEVRTSSKASMSKILEAIFIEKYYSTISKYSSPSVKLKAFFFNARTLDEVKYSFYVIPSDFFCIVMAVFVLGPPKVCPEEKVLGRSSKKGSIKSPIGKSPFRIIKIS